MRKGILALTLAVCLIGLTGQSWAAETASISVTVSLEEAVSVSVTPDTWVIGPIGLSGSDGPESFTAENEGNVAIDLTITGTNGADGWTLAASAGAETFSVAVADPAITLTTGDQSLATNVAVSGTKAIDLTYSAPTSSSAGGGADQGFSVTVSATKYVPGP